MPPWAPEVFRTTHIRPSAPRAPVLPGVLLLFSDDVLIHVSSAGNLRDALSTKGLRHRRTTHFACEVIFDHRYRTARAAELAQFLTPRS